MGQDHLRLFEHCMDAAGRIETPRSGFQSLYARVTIWMTSSAKNLATNIACVVMLRGDDFRGQYWDIVEIPIITAAVDVTLSSTIFHY